MDRISREDRSRIMAKIGGRNTGIELRVRRALWARGCRYRTHVASLPGRPDVVFPREGLAIFIHGDFWHGWRFPGWKGRLPAFWQEKIERNRERDRRTVRSLRRAGWTVLSIWEHEVDRDLADVAEKIVAVRSRLAKAKERH